MLSLSGISIVISMVFAAPYLASQGSKWTGLIYGIFSPLCHQTPQRCFFFFGYPLAVCSRCLGIYAGFFAGSVVFPFVKGFSKTSIPKMSMFLLFSAPIAVDTVGNFLQIWMTPGGIRLFLGILWGGILPFYFIGGIASALQSIRRSNPGS